MRTPFYFLGLLTAVFFFSCAAEQKPKKLIITGKVTVNWSKKVNLRHGTISLAESWSGQTDHRDSIIPVEEDGVFRLDLALEQERLYTFSHQEQKVAFIAFPGDSIHIDLAAEKVFSGSNAAQNNHLNTMNNHIQAIENHIVNASKDYFGSAMEVYFTKLDSVKEAYLDTHRDFKKQQSVAPAYEEMIVNDIDYRMRFYKIIYPAFHEMYTRDTLQIDQSYFDTITKGNLEDPSLLESSNYVLFLDRYVDIMAAGKLRFRNFYDAGIQKIGPKYHAIKELQAHSEIKEYLMNEHLKKSISNYGITYLEAIWKDYKTNSKNIPLKKQLEEMYAKAENRRMEADTILVYKKIGNIALEAHVFYPEGHTADKKTATYAFFHGGGWAVGIPEWGYKNCQRYRDKGMVAVSFEYRLIDIHQSNIIHCIEDAKSAITWLREQAPTMGIDPGSIVSAGFSAGGHLAAATAILDTFEAAEVKYSGKPNAFITHSASYNTTKSNFFSRQSNGQPESISIFHHVKKNLPPSISFHGTRDHLAPISEFAEYRDKMEGFNNDFAYQIFEGVGHFFNDPKASKTVMERTDAFLQKLGYIEE